MSFCQFYTWVNQHKNCAINSIELRNIKMLVKLFPDCFYAENEFGVDSILAWCKDDGHPNSNDNVEFSLRFQNGKQVNYIINALYNDREFQLQSVVKWDNSIEWFALPEEDLDAGDLL